MRPWKATRKVSWTAQGLDRKDLRRRSLRLGRSLCLLLVLLRAHDVNQEATKERGDANRNCVSHHICQFASEGCVPFID